MFFALICHDKPGALALRMQTRADHLAYVERTGVVAQAGPLLGDDGGMVGSLIILDVADRAAAQVWADGDPYAQAGLFDRVEIVAWKRVIGG
ncbi:YciI family protein [Meridianimarinicoccus sp. RP-17]|uniref:YciI family protein n=1 Tax=Meridianimarinicoccus zhengii TaxID=2056810 RepID=UPI000DAEF304|nr:YciI family protein [Phycocomes zhengii]